MTLRNNKLYRLWIGIKCIAKKSNGIISLCPDWNNDFKAFSDWFYTLGIPLHRVHRKDLMLNRLAGSDEYNPTTTRFVTRSEIAISLKGLTKSNTSGYRGVVKDRHSDAYRSCLTVEGSKITISVRSTKYQAMLDRDQYIKDHNLNHTANGYTDVSVLVIKPLESIHIKYSFKDDYMLSGLLSNLINGTTANTTILKWFKLSGLNLADIKSELNCILQDHDFTGKYVVVETCIRKLILNVHSVVKYPL